jgi:hypothetical protein
MEGGQRRRGVKGEERNKWGEGQQKNKNQNISEKYHLLNTNTSTT